MTGSGFVLTAVVGPRQRAIDTAKSRMRVRVDKAGIFSAFGHDHDIAVPIASGSVDPAARQVALRIRTERLRVRDLNASHKERKEIQRTMLGPDVLDAEHNPEILFRSMRIELAGNRAWKIHGALTLHGYTRPVTVDVRERNGHYEGKSYFRQTEFGIKPIRFAGGAIRVKDQIKIEFDIQLAR